MQFKALLTTAILAATALAAPHGDAMGHGLAARVATRTQRKTNPLSKVAGSVEGPIANSNVSHVEYSSNWAGAVYESPPSGTFTAVSATITVPVPSATAAGTYSASAWVGIDGDTYGNAILQTGVDFTATKSGSKTTYSFDAWYEWYPDYAYDFSLTVSAGDVIFMSVTSSSSTKGVAVIENLTTGKSVSKTITSSSALGGQNAEWIVEDFESGGSLVAFADFGTVLFTGAVAKTSSGTSVGTSDATIIDIKQSNKVLTSVSIPSSSEVEVTYE
ncbi:putative aspergillopepsin-2 protein [Neofusicoccum parvum]|uniref:Aspergillopepsin-2 n=3 Tax=Neofusicoccum TaxID=407951 RepID=A0ABR3SYW3_9PEZI|nr:putative aspergillopepsin-2 protein [Neofusicoccum parvum UCRNP2]GME35690.1 putative aspergillopepsin-2 protein [Neofusicoccum parvum]GME53269.1 putative aspergillopepsin-2 protein [Neofusicoccum parvum]